MIEVMPESSGPMLAVRATGTLSGNDYSEVWIPALQQVIEKYGKCRCLLYMDEEFKGWDLAAMWEDARFGFVHRNDFDKIAIVGGPGWVEWGTKVAGALMSGEVKTFTAEKLADALKWAAE
ncbi:STAS/SEC14 domain-containing protein [Maridesulfovibrio sp. FT414]|uniref:STAS/SEC14 domain-containing protein n=1 Tax=Maridesulfovibrio sp. FT414 TaxID=2979469 RepID=UPI003D80529D